MLLYTTGTPADMLRSTDFADFFVTKVEPVSENWWLDTAAGLATTVLLCFLGLALIVAPLVVLYKRGMLDDLSCCK
jgi:hypothetical protein